MKHPIRQLNKVEVKYNYLDPEYLEDYNMHLLGVCYKSKVKESIDLVAPISGKVVHIETSDSLEGYTLIVSTKDYLIKLTNLDSIDVEYGSQFKEGQLLATFGTSINDSTKDYICVKVSKFTTNLINKWDAIPEDFTDPLTIFNN